MLAAPGGAKMLHAPVILLREGADVSQGRSLIVSNIRACESVVEVVKSTLGPQGMDKLIEDGSRVTITNDGATIMDLLSVIHPAAAMLVDVAKSQDNEVGDGTTSVVVIAGELLKEAKAFIEDGVHPQIIVAGYRRACTLALGRLRELQIDLKTLSPAERQRVVVKCAETTLNSKLLNAQKSFFANMVSEAVTSLDEDMEKSLIGVKKIPGGSVTDSFLVKGVAFKKTFSYAGFEQQPKKLLNPKVILLNIELELKAEKDNAEVRISDPADYQSIVDAEWSIIYDQLDLIVKSGANVVFSRLAIGDLATQYFADRDVFCAGRVEETDLKRTAKATGASILSTVTDINSAQSLGTCGEFEEVQLGAERYNILRGCPHAKTATILLRGGAQQFIDEAERSLNDAIMIVRRALKLQQIVGGGGSIEMELSFFLREVSLSIAGKPQMIISAFARALEVIPRALAENSGLNATDILNKLRQLHSRKSEAYRWMGVDCLGCSNINGGGAAISIGAATSKDAPETLQVSHVVDTFANYIWEPSMVKLNAIAAATEAVCMILSVDEMVKIPKSNPEPNGGRRQAPQMPGGRGRRV